MILHFSGDTEVSEKKYFPETENKIKAKCNILMEIWWSSRLREEGEEVFPPQMNVLSNCQVSWNKSENVRQVLIHEEWKKKQRAVLL